MAGKTRRGRSIRGGRRNRTRVQRAGKYRSVPWSGWGAEAPSARERHAMKRNCPPGKCFLGPGVSFPVCKKGTCDVSSKGLWAAYVRAKQWGGPTKKYRGKAKPRHARRVYTKAARTARRRLQQRRFRVEK